MLKKLIIFTVTVIGLNANGASDQIDEGSVPRRALLCPDTKITLSPRLVLIYDEFAVINDGIRMDKDENGNFDHNRLMTTRHKVDMKNLTLTWRSEAPTQCREINLLPLQMN